jgi:hypothetical protein
MPGETFDLYMEAFDGFSKQNVHDAETARQAAALFDLLATTLQHPNATLPPERPARIPPEFWAMAPAMLEKLREVSPTPGLRAEGVLAAQTSASVLRAQFPD